MAEKTELTSEEKLLGMIEGAGAGAGVVSRQSSVPSDVGARSPRPNLFSMFQNFSSPSLKSIREMEINFKWVNIILLMFSLALLSYLAYDYTLKSNMPLGRVYYSDFPFNIRSAKEIVSLLPKSQYLGLAGRRDIFTAPKKEVVAPVKAPEPPPAPPLVDPIDGMKSSMSVVGIIWGAKPQVLIENKREGRTYLLSEGDSVGLPTVKKIFKNKIILEFEGREFELI